MRRYTRVVAFWRATMLALACLGLVASPALGQHGGSQPSPNRKTTMTIKRASKPDVKLDQKGSLVGHLLNSSGQPIAQATMTLWKGDSRLERTRTDEQGRFRFTRLRGGPYRIATERNFVEFRAWPAQIAPPRAADRLLVAPNTLTARGQQPLNEAFAFNPFLMGTIVAAAIAIPIAVHNSGDGQLPDGS